MLLRGWRGRPGRGRAACRRSGDALAGRTGHRYGARAAVADSSAGTAASGVVRMRTAPAPSRQRNCSRYRWSGPPGCAPADGIPPPCAAPKPTNRPDIAARSQLQAGNSTRYRRLCRDPTCLNTAWSLLRRGSFAPASSGNRRSVTNSSVAVLPKTYHSKPAAPDSRSRSANSNEIASSLNASVLRSRKSRNDEVEQHTPEPRTPLVELRNEFLLHVGT